MVTQEFPEESDVLIIGGGVIGICSAYYLAANGRHVTVIDQGAIGGGCSFGNAGLIVPSHLVPLAAPGVLAQGLKWMLDAESPFYIKPRLDSDLISWLWRFRAHCREEPMRRAIPVIQALGEASADLYGRLVEEEQLDCHYGQAGGMMVYRTQKGFDHGAAEGRMLEEHGVTVELLDRREVVAKEPAVREDVAGAVYYPRDAHLDPALFVTALAERVEERGVVLLPDTRVTGFKREGQLLVAVKTSRGTLRPAQVVLATGSWSPGLARDLGLKLPIQPAKGYSVTFARPDNFPRTPLLLGEARVAVTPMGPRGRFAGTLEMAGMDLSINERRVEAIKRAGSDYLGIDASSLSDVQVWAGLRPCTPDGLPYLGRSSAATNLIIAAGHAMIGVSSGPITGKLVSQIVENQPADIDLAPLRPERFGK